MRNQPKTDSRMTPDMIAKRRIAETAARQERLLTLSGVVIAATTTMIAFVEIRSNDGAPQINGMSHLAVFSQPAKYHEERVKLASDGGGPAIPADPIGRADGQGDVRADLAGAVDYTPVGAIDNLGIAKGGREKEQPAPQALVYTMKSVTREQAIFIGPNGILTLKKGEAAEGVGRILDIVWRDGRWAAVIGPLDAAPASLKKNQSAR